MRRRMGSGMQWCATPTICGLGLLLTTNPVFGQQSKTAPLVPVAIQFQSEGKPVSENAPPETTAEPDKVAEKSKEPISLPPLGVPNLTLANVGTGQTPDDLVAGRLPASIVLPYGPDRTNAPSWVQKTWTAPVYCHQPLYFEDAMLERHGHERFPCLTPLTSGARFIASAATMPYMVWLQPPLQEMPNTGHYRPGSAVPALRERLPYDKGALRFQLLTLGAGAVVVTP